MGGALLHVAQYGSSELSEVADTAILPFPSQVGHSIVPAPKHIVQIDISAPPLPLDLMKISNSLACLHMEAIYLRIEECQKLEAQSWPH